MVWNAFADRFKKPRGSKERRRRDRTAVRERESWMTGLGGESLEGRALLANASLVGNDLQIDFTFTGSTAEAVTIASDGTNYTLGGDITGTTSFSVASVNKITLSASGNSTAQSMTFQGGTAFTLSQGLASTGVDSVTVSQVINAGGGSAAISMTTPGAIDIAANLTAGSGGVTLNANAAAATGNLSAVTVRNYATVTTTGGGNTSVTGTSGSGSAAYNLGVYVFDYGTITASSGGTVTVAGTGGSGSGGSNHGVFVQGGVITSGGGSVSVTGQGGGASSGGYFVGVAVVQAGTITAGGSGTVTVAGTGGAGAANNNWGVYVANFDSKITSSGGTVSVTGQGGGGSTGSEGYGVLAVVGGSITSGGGSINVTATGNTGTSPAAALWLQSSGSIASGSNAPVTITADSVKLDSGTSISSGSGTTTIQPRTSGTLINLGGADVLSGSPLTLGLTDAELDLVTAGTLGLGSTSAGTLTISAPISPANTNSLSLKTGSSISGSTNTLTVSTLALEAATGISVTTAVTTFSSITNSTSGAISFSQTGAIAVPTISAPGNVTITATGDITVGTTITATGNTVALTSTTGSINGGSLITAGTATLAAATGIGNTTALSLAAPTISADSTAGKINLANALGTAVTVSSLTSAGTSNPGGALITFNQSGGGTATFNSVSTIGFGSAAYSGWGVVSLVNNGGGITIASSGVTTALMTSTILLVTTGSGNIAVNAPVNAGLNDGNVSLIAAGSISGSGLITGAQGSLVANTGINVNGNLALGFSTITSAAGDISVTNVYGIAVPNAITTTGDVTLTSGQDIVLSNPITAATGKTVTLTATGAAGGGAIQGSSLITADTVDLNATQGIGTTGAINLASFFVSADTTAGAIDINNTSGTAVSVTSLTTSDGAAITFDQTGAGGIGLDGNVTSTTGTVTLTSQQGIIRNSGTITAGTLSATAGTGLSVTTAVTTFNTVASTTGAISISQTGAIALPTITAASTLSITATGAITQQEPSALTVNSGAASFTTSNADVILDQANAFGSTINVTTTGTGNVEINDSGTTSLGTLSLGTGTLNVTTSGAITQTAAIVQTAGAGAATFETGGAVITLTNTGNNFTGPVNLRNSGAKNISIVDSSGLILGAVSQATTQANTLAVTVLAGNITQQAGTAISIGTGGATFTAVNGSDIILDAASNALNGSATFAPIVGVGNQLRNLSFTNGRAIQVPNGLDISGNLVITASGNITDGTPFTVGGSSTFQTLSSSANITLTGDNQFNGSGGSLNLATVGSGSASVTGTTKAIALGTVDIGGTLTVETTDAVTDAGLISVIGATSLKGSTITLDTVGSKYTGALSLESTVGNTSVSGTASAVNLGTVSVAGDLAVSSTLAITNSGKFTVAGASAFTTTANNASITLDGSAGGSASSFSGLVSFSAQGTGSAALTNVTGPLGISTATFGGTFTLSATGTITSDDSGGGITGRAVGPAGAITLTSSTGNVVLAEPLVSGGGNVTLAATLGSVTSTASGGGGDAAGTIATGAAANSGAGSGFLMITAGTGINLQATVSTSSSDNNAGGAGIAGNITFNAKSIAVTQAITAIGGSNTSATPGPAVAGSGGSAGAVTLTASNGAISVVDITATGGTGIKAVGGGGGSVLLQTTGGAGTITAAAVTTTGGKGGTGFNSGNAGNIEFNSDAAALITLNGDLIAIGGSGVVQGSGGNITVQDKAVITRNTLVDTGVTAGDVVFNSSVHSVSTTPYSLTVTAGDGSVTFVGELGAPITGFLDNRLLSLSASGAAVAIEKSVSTTGAAGISVSATSITIGNGGSADTVVFNTNAAVGGGATANGVVSLNSTTTTLTDNLTITRGTGAITFSNETLVGGDYDLTINGTGTDVTGGNVSFLGDTSDLGSVSLAQVGVLVVGTGTTDTFSSDDFVYADTGTGTATFNAATTMQTSAGPGLVVSTAGTVTTNESITTTNAPITLTSTTAGVAINTADRSYATSGGAVTITGKGVTQAARHGINSGSGKIIVDGDPSGTDPGAIVLSGVLTTTYASPGGESDYAVLLRDATTVTFNGITASSGVVQIGTAGISPADVTGNVTQTSNNNAGLVVNIFAANTGANITVNGSNNNANNIANLATITLPNVLSIRDDADGVNVLNNLTAEQISILTRGGNLAIGTSNISTTTGTIFLQGQGVTQGAGSTITPGTITASTVIVDASDFRFGQGFSAVNMAGTITTTSTASPAVTFRGASTIVLPQVNATGAGSSVQINDGNTSSGAVSQTTGKILNVTTVNVNTRGSVTLDQANTITNVSGITYGGAVAVNDLAGLTLTGAIGRWTTGADSVAVTTTGLLDLNGQNITGSNVTLTGVSVTSSGGTVSGTGTITIDAQDGSINLTGTSLTTGLNNGTVQLLDAGGNVVIGSISTNTGGSVVLGGSGGDVLAGNVTQIAAITTGTLSGNVGGSVTLTNGGNTFGAIGTFTAGGAITIVDSTLGLNVSGAVTNSNTGLVSITTTGGGLAVTASGSVEGSGVSLSNGNGAIALAGPINGNSGTVTLTAAGGTNGISQSGLGLITTTGALTGSSPGSLSLGLANQLGQFGPFDVTAAGSTLTLNDATGGLALAGDITVNTGALSIATAGGALAFGTRSVTANAGSTAAMTLTGVGMTQSAGSTINAGTGLITLDANAGTIVMAGTTQTSSASTSAIIIRDAGATQLGTVSAAQGTVTIGVSADITGAVTQVGPLAASKLIVNTAGSVNLSTDSANEVANLNGIVTLGNFSLRDSTLGLILLANVSAGDGSNAGAVSIETLGGSLQIGTRLITAYGNVTLQGAGVTTSAGSVISANGGNILLDGYDGTTRGSISLLGTLTTTSNSSAAVTIRDADSVAFAGITTGSTGTTTLGVSGQAVNAVTQTGALVTGTLAGNSGQVTLTNASNEVAFLGPYTSSSAFALKDSTGGLTFSGDVVTEGTTTITTPGALNLATYDLWALNSGSVTNFSQLTLTAVGIAQSATAGTSSIKADTTAFIAATGDIDLLNPDNDFTGTVTLKATGAFVAVRDANNMTLSTLGGNIGSNTAVKGIAGKTLVLATENLSTGTGYVYLESEGGNLTTTGTITTSTGDITLKSSDAVTGYLLTINHAVSSTSAGDIVLVGGKIEHNAQDVTTTGAGTISATALTGDLTMVNGTVYSTGSGAITMTAADDIELATVTTTGNVTLTATGGAVIDVLTGETANITGNVVTITASTGIGTSDGGTTIDDIETTASQLDLTSTTGGIYVNNIGAVQLGNATGGVNTVTSGDIVITATGAITTGSTITTGGGNGDISISNIATGATGGITLSNAVTANGSGDVTITAKAALAVNAGVTSSSGDISLTGLGVTQAASTTVNAGTGTILIDGTGGAIDLDGTLQSGGTGTVVTVRDATTVALGTITAASGTVAIGVNDISGAVTQNTGLAITAGTLTVDTNAAVTLTNTNVIANLGAVTTSGNFALTDAGGLTLTGASSSGGTYTITTTGVLALGSQNVIASGDVSLTGAGITQGSGSTVNAGSGTILVDANAAVFNLAGSLVTTSSSSTAVQILDGGSSTNSLGTITAASGTVVIGANDTTGDVDQTVGTSITASTLTADLNSPLRLSNSGNAIGTLGAVTIDGGNFALVDNGTLTVAGPVFATDEVSITANGGLMTITGNISVAGSDLILSATGINQTGGAITTPNAIISGNGGNISLTQSGNNFTGDVSITNTGAATTAITDSNAIRFDAVSVGTGTFTVNSTGNITQSPAGITTGGAVVLSAGTGAITLTTSTNDFGGAVSATNTGGAAIALRDANAIQLGAVSASGTLTVTAVGITQTGDGVTAASTASFTAGAGVITLTDSDNDFQGTVALSNSGANNVAITDTNAIKLAASSVGSGTLTVTAVGITQSGAITQAASAGTATFNGGAAAITLTNAGNDFTGAVAANNSGTNAIQITDKNALVLGTTTTQDALTVIAGGAVTQSGNVSVVGATSVTATGFDITLDRAGNAFIGAVSLTGANVEVKNGNDLVLGPIVATGTTKASAAGDIDQVDAPTAGITSTGLATFTTLTAGKSIRLDNTLNNFAGGVSVGGTSLVDVSVFNPLYPLVLDAFNLTGTLAIQAKGITQSGPLTVGGTSSFDGGAGVVTINDADNDFTGAVSAQNTGNNAVTLVDKTAILLGSISTAGVLTVTAVGITQNQPLTASNTAKFDSSTGNIVLNNANNDFSGAVWLTTSGSGNATVVDKNAIEIVVPGIGGNLSVTAGGDITDGPGIFVAGTATFDAGSANVDFDKTHSDFNTVVITLANNVTLFDSGRIAFGASTITGALSVTANGPISQSGALAVTGTATFDAGPTNDITLNDAGNAFSTVVITNGQDVSLRDTDAIVLGTINVSDTLTITAVGITQSGAITQAPGAGAATFNGGAAAITLTNSGNNFTGPVAANNTGANAIQITDAGALILGAVTTANNLTIVAGGAVTQDTGTALDVDGTTSVTATGFAITLTNTGNDFGGAVSLTGQNVAVYDSTSLLLGPTVATGTYAATANTGDITQVASPAAGITATGTATFTANGTQANILLDNPSNSFAGGVSIVASDADNITIIDTSASQLILSAISITGNLTIQANGITQTGAVAVAGKTSLTSTGGNIDLGSTTNDFDTVEITTTGTSAAVDLGDADGITFLASALGTGGFIIDAASIAQTGPITQQSSAGAVSLTARAGTLVLDDAGNSFTGAVSASTTDGNAISLTNSTAITLGTVTAAIGTATTGGDITITANGVNATGGADSVTTTGDILLQPLAKTTTIGVAGGAGSVQFAQSVFNTTITNGAQSITIGRADQSGTITVGAVTFRDPTIIRAPSGSVRVTGQITGSDNASITISASPTTVTLASNIVTAGNAITIDNGSGGNTAVVLGNSTTLDTTNSGAVTTGAAVTIRGTVTSDTTNYALTIKGGTDGDVLVTNTIGAVGAGVALSSLAISGNDITLASIDGVTGTTSITGADGTDDGTVTLTSQTYTVTGAFIVAAGATGNTLLGGTVRTAGGAITLDATKLTSNATLDATDNGAVPAGAAITLTRGVLLQGYTLTTIGGSGGSSSTNLVGPTNLSNGTLVVESGDLDVGTGALTPAQVTVTQNTTLQVNAGSLYVSANSTINATGKTLTLLADAITIASGSDSIVASKVTLAPVTTSRNIFLGAAAGTGLVLGQTTFLAIDAASIQIGQAGNTGDVTMGMLTLAGTTLVVVADGVGAGVIVDGLFTSTGSTASGVGLEITGSGATTLLNAGIVSATDVIINDALEVGVGSVTIDTSGGNADVTISGGTAGIFATSGGTNGLVINAGTGTVGLGSSAGFGDNAGAGSLVTDVTITAGATTIGASASQIAGTFSLPAGTLSLAANLTAGTIDVSSTLGLTLAGNVVLTAPTGIALAGPVDGAFALSANSAGTTTFGGAIGGTTRLASLTTNAGGTTVLAGGSVKTTGSQTFNDAITLSANTTLDSSSGGGITLAGAVDAAVSGGSSLTVNTAGTTTFGGIVGGTKTLSSVTTDAAGSTAINGGAITTTGGQAFNDPVTIGANTTLTGTLVTLAQLTGNAKNLTVAGNTSLTGQVTGVANLAVSGTALIGADVSTSGSQAYTGLVTLAAGVTLTGTDPTFTAGVAGAGNNLTLNFSGTTAINGAKFTGIANLATGNGGTTTLTGVVTTSGSQIYGDAVTLLGATTAASSGSGAITFSSTVNGSFDLLVNTAGATTFGGAVGGTVALSGLFIDAGGTTAINGGSVRTTGPQTYDDAVTLGASTTLTGSLITFGATLAGGGNALAIDGPVFFGGGRAVFNGTVSGVSNLSVVNTAAINTASITTTGSQAYGGTVTLGAPTVTLTGTDPTFTAGVVGAGNSLVLQFSGTTAIDGATFTGINKLTTRSGGTTTLTGPLTTTGSQRYGDVVSLLGATTLAGDGITFDDSVDGTQALVINDSGSTFFGGFVGDSTPLASLAVTAVGGIEIAGGVVTTQGTQTYNDAVTLTSNAVLTGSTITTTSTVAGGGNSLTVTGNAVVNGAISDVTDYVVSGTSSLAANVSTSGLQTFQGAVTLAQDVTLASSGSGSISFVGAVNGAKNLVVNTAATTTFDGAVGGTTALASLVTDAGGSVAINGGAVTTTGTQTYNDAVSLGANTTLTGSTITTAGTLTGNSRSLGVTGNAVIGGAVNRSPSSLSVSGTTAVNTASIRTLGSQTYGGLVTLGSPTVTLSGTNATFTGGVAGAGNSLVLTFSGTTAIDGPSFTGIANLTSDGGGTTTLTGAIQTSGSQTYGDAVTLLADTTASSTGSGAIAFTGTVNGARALVVNTAGTTTFGAAVGGTTPLASLFTDAAGTTAINSGAITTTGTQTYAGPVTLGAATALTGSKVTTSGTVAGGGNSLGIVGNAVVDGAVSGVSDFAISGVASLGADVSTTASQTFVDAVTLTTGVTLTSSSSGPITFGTTIDGAQTLAINTSGATVFLGAVGGTTPLTSLVTDAGGTVTINGGSVRTSGTQTYNDAVTLGANTTLTGSTVTLGSTLAGGGKSLGVTGNAVVGGAVSGLSSLSVSGTTAANTGSIATTGSQTFGGLVTLGAPTVTFTGTSGTFTGGVAGGGNSLVLTFSGTTALGTGTVSGIQNLTSNGGGTTTLTGTIETTGTQTYADAVTLLGDTTTKGTTMTFAAVTGGGRDLTVTGAAVLGGTVSGVDALTVSGTTAVNVASIATTGPQTYGGLVTLGSPTVTLSGTDSTFTGGVAGAGNSLVLTFSGATAIVGADFTGIANLTSNGGGTTTLTGTIDTTGTQTYTDAVTLLGPTTTKGTTVSFANVTGGSQPLTVTGNAVFAGTATGLASLFVSGTTSLLGGMKTSGAQTYQGALTIAGAAVLAASSFTSGSTIAVGSNALTIKTDTISLGGLVSGTSTLAIQVRSAATSVGIGDGAAGTLSLPTAALNLLQNGFSSIKLGNMGATGPVTVTSSTFRDPITIMGGGTLTLDGLIRTGQGADSGSITLSADTLVLNAGIQTVGQNVRLGAINGNVTISAGAIQTQAPLDSGLASGGIFIAVTGTGSVNLLSTLSTVGASNATGTGSDGGTISITTNTGSISVGSLITDGGASSANATGGQAGAILLASGSGTPVTLNGGTISAQGGYGIGGQPSGGNIAFGAVTLANAATVVTTGPTGGDIAFNGPVNGGQALSLVAGTGKVTLGGLFGGQTPLTSLAVLSGETTISGGGVKTTAAQTYAAPVTVTGAAALESTAAGGLTFASTIDGPGTLSLATAGLSSLSGAVGGVVPLAAVQTSGGTTRIASTGVTTSGNQTYGGLVQLAAPTVTLKGDTGSFASGVAGGGNGLVLDFSGTSAIDGTFAGLSSLTTQGGGTTTLTGSVTTSGPQTYRDTVTLLGHTTLTGTTITTGSTLSGGGKNLSVAGNAVIGGDVSAVATLAITGTTALNAANVTTTGTQSYGGLLTLGANTTLTGTTPSFGAGVAGAGRDLTLGFSGTTTIVGEAFTGIRDLITDGGGTTALTGPLVTSGSQSFREAVALVGATALEGTRIDFLAAVDGARNLGLAATAGPVNFAAAVGGVTPLGSLAITKASAVNAAGRIVLTGSAPGANRTGLTIGTGVNNVNLAQSGNSVTGFAANGVVLQGGSKASTFANFTISGNGETGLLVQAGDSTGTVIRNNTVGGNGFNGIWLNGAVPSVSVTGNTLTNNNNNGIVVSGPATGVTISGNTITGSGLTGIRTEVVAGQSTTGLVISGNTSQKNEENGLIVSGGTGTTVTGNVFSTNALQGVVLTLGATGTSVQGNQIFRNGGIGVVLSGPTTVGNSILSNSIYGNLRGGIALLQQANRQQAAPALTSARVAGGQITIAGTIKGRVGDVVRIQFFSNLPSDAANAGTVQGRTLIGFRDVRITKATMPFSASFSAAGIPAKAWISATATRLVSGLPSDTSQFSAGVRATA